MKSAGLAMRQQRLAITAFALCLSCIPFRISFLGNLGPRFISRTNGQHRFISRTNGQQTFSSTAYLLDALEKELTNLAYGLNNGGSSSKVEAALKDMRASYMIMMLGGFSAGKSTIINAGTGRQACETGVNPTTNTTHAVKGPWENVDLIDLPGINAGMHPEHETMAMKQVDRANLVILVTTAHRPVTGSDMHVFKQILAQSHETLIAINYWNVLRRDQDKVACMDRVRAIASEYQVESSNIFRPDVGQAEEEGKDDFDFEKFKACIPKLLKSNERQRAMKVHTACEQILNVVEEMLMDGERELSDLKATHNTISSRMEDELQKQLRDLQKKSASLVERLDDLESQRPDFHVPAMPDMPPPSQDSSSAVGGAVQGASIGAKVGGPGGALVGAFWGAVMGDADRKARQQAEARNTAESAARMAAFVKKAEHACAAWESRKRRMLDEQAVISEQTDICNKEYQTQMESRYEEHERLMSNVMGALKRLQKTKNDVKGIQESARSLLGIF